MGVKHIQTDTQKRLFKCILSTKNLYIVIGLPEVWKKDKLVYFLSYLNINYFIHDVDIFKKLVIREILPIAKLTLTPKLKTDYRYNIHMVSYEKLFLYNQSQITLSYT